MTPAVLTEQREALHLTQAELARVLGVSKNTIWRWEHHERALPPWLGLALLGIRTEFTFSPRPKRDG